MNGNRNNFESLEKCVQTCGEVKYYYGSNIGFIFIISHLNLIECIIFIVITITYIFVYHTIHITNSVSNNLNILADNFVGKIFKKNINGRI